MAKWDSSRTWSLGFLGYAEATFAWSGEEHGRRKCTEKALLLIDATPFFNINDVPKDGNFQRLPAHEGCPEGIP